MVDVLAIVCHPDDVEIGMGGTIAKMVRTGMSVGILDLSNGEPTPEGTPDLRATEAEKAKTILGVDFRITLDMPNRYIFDSVENRTKVATVIREHRPKAIFMHYWDDYHPDHVQGFNIVYAARFYGKLTKTDMPHEPYYTPKMYFYAPIHIQYTIKPSFIIGLDDEDIDKKLEALRCYQSQFKDKQELLHDYAKGRTSHSGTLIGRKWGEPFFSKEEMSIDDLRTIL